ncbi:MAG: hypothetical protein ACI9WM_002085, partial [Arenicella sp.]
KTQHTCVLQLNLALFHEIIKCIKANPKINIDDDTSVYYTETAVVVHQAYPQVFDDKISFESNLSILDLLFNLGPETKEYLMRSQ